MKNETKNGELFKEHDRPENVMIKHAELEGWFDRQRRGELHIPKMKCVQGGYELTLLWLDGRKLKSFADGSELAIAPVNQRLT
jgi:hypothetical protein